MRRLTMPSRSPVHFSPLSRASSRVVALASSGSAAKAAEQRFSTIAAMAIAGRILELVAPLESVVTLENLSPQKYRAPTPIYSTVESKPGTSTTKRPPAWQIASTFKESSRWRQTYQGSFFSSSSSLNQLSEAKSRARGSSSASSGPQPPSSSEHSSRREMRVALTLSRSGSLR